MYITLAGNRPVAKAEISGIAALSGELSSQLVHALDEAENTGPSPVLFIHVVGDASLAPLSSWPGKTDIRSVTGWEKLLRRIERSDCTTIVLVEHACSRLALELLLVADRRLASRDFSIQWAMPGKEVWPSMALYRLARQIGESRARKLSVEAADVSAHRALELNIVDDIVDNGIHGSDPILRVAQYAPADDFPFCRRLIEESLSASFDEALGAHLAACERALRRSSAIERTLARDFMSAV